MADINTTTSPPTGTQPGVPETTARTTVLGGQGQAGSSADEQVEGEDINKNFDEKSPAGHEDGILESIGKAITEPMRDAADDGEGAPTPP